MNQFIDKEPQAALLNLNLGKEWIIVSYKFVARNTWGILTVIHSLWEKLI